MDAPDFDWGETFALCMKHYGGKMEDWLNEPLCTVVYRFQYALKWEMETRQNFEMLLVGAKVTQSLS